MNARVFPPAAIVLGLVLSLVVAPSVAPSQTGDHHWKVANYSVGKYGTKEYEELSFWVKEGRRANIDYAYGAPEKELCPEKELHLVYLGKDICQGKPCFKVQFPNTLVLSVIPVGPSLNVMDEKGKYSKTFQYEYEGPVDGIGTFCAVCAQDEDEAMTLLKDYYLK